jgi:hypothetical protein
MTIYLIKKDNQTEEFNNVIEWDKNYVVYKAGRGTCKIYTGEDEYFTDEMPQPEATE